MKDVTSAVTTPSPATGSSKKPTLLIWSLTFAPVVLATGIGVTVVVGDVPRLTVGVLLVAMTLLLVLGRVPVGVAMGVPGVLGVLSIAGVPAFARAFGEGPYSTMASWELSVLPMFIFMGLVLWRSGVTTRMYDAAEKWLGWLPGGLAITTNFAGTGLAAASGSSIGITYAVGRIGLPEMLRAGYNKRVAAGSVLAAGASGQLIPPSIGLVVFAGVASIPIGPQLLAGIIPGLLVTLFLGILMVALALAFPKLAPRSNVAATWGSRIASLLQVWPIPMLTLIVLGGMYGGFLTATEAGAAGALGAVIVAAWISRRSFPRVLKEAIVATVGSVGSVFFILIGAALLNRALTLTGLSEVIANAFSSDSMGLWTFVALLMLVTLVLGMFMEPIAMMLLLVPILLPAVEAHGLSAIWFGVFMVMMAELAMITPPVGILAFVVHKIAGEPEVRRYARIRLGDIFFAASFLIPVALFVLVLTVLFPQLVEFLPQNSVS